MADNLPGELFAREILARLPMKSLVRCRSVCKLWNSLFYNPDILSHLDQNRNRELEDDDYIICMNDYEDPKNKSPPYGLAMLSRNNFSETRMDYSNSVVPYPLYDLVHLVGSINGLVCIAFYECHNLQFILWNPIIRFFKKIIVPEHLGFDHAYPMLFGFGWDSVTNDYKLIIARTESSETPAAVYSCKTDCWSNFWANSILSLENCCKPAPCIIVNGFPYWRTVESLSSTDNAIVKFDIKNNKFTYLKVPFRDLYNYSLINLNDCLAALIGYACRYATDIYRFDEESSIWVKMYAIDESAEILVKTLCIRMVFRRMSVFMKPVCFKYGGEIVFQGKKKLYDPKSHTSKRCRCGTCTCLVRLPSKCIDCDGSPINGFSYTPSMLALPGMKALRRS